MTEELIPEMHDIGKLTNKKHNFEDLGIDLKTRTWRGILEHHCSEGFDKYPTSLDTFVLCIADSLAAAVSRPLRGIGQHAVYNVHKLWNPPREKITVPPIRTDKGVQEILNFIATKSSADEFFKKYGMMLRERTEDAHPGCNITTLYTHSKLTGQFYRILMSIRDKQIENTNINGKTKGEVSNLINKARNTWKLTVLKCKIHFPQNPVRAKDMNVFKILENFVGDIKTKFQDSVIFSTSNELLLVSPLESNVLEYIKGRTKEFGFWLDVNQENQLIRGLNLEKIRKAHSEYPDLLPEVEPPICEVCQIRKASKEIVKEDVTEHLCEKCSGIRDLGTMLSKLVEWEESGNPRVTYIKVSLGMDELVESLKKLYTDYLAHVGVSNAEEKAEIRFSVLSEFQGDYDDFLSRLESSVINEYGEENVQQILKDFFCIKIEGASEIKGILDIYEGIFKEYFPGFMTRSPIKLSITCANVKFPFIWNWKRLNAPKDNINVSLVGRGEMNLKLKQIDDLLSIRLPSRKLLFDLSRAAEISKKLAWIMLTDKGDRKAYRDFEGLRRAVASSGIDYNSILVFAKMMGD